jgi:glycosyltransferase involved in cell wall biosynthesis
MKVCFVGLENLPALAREYHRHGIGGEELQQTLIAKALATRGYHVSMVVADYGQSDSAVWHGVTTYKAFRTDAGLPILRFVYPRWTGTWAALMRANADVYYTSCAGMHIGLVSMFCRRHRRGMVHRLAHDTDADQNNLLIRYTRDKKLYEYGLRRADIVLCQHAAQQRALMKNFALSSIVADMLVDPPACQFDRDQRDLEILWVNNLRDFKRPDLALQLALQLPCHHIHMIGGPALGFSDLYQSIESAAMNVPNLTFYGRVPYHEIGDFYDRTKVFVNTADVEGFPNSFLQSWCRGVPVVSLFDPNGLIKREGLGVSAHSINDMASAVHRFITDETEWRKASQRCRTYMERTHGDDVVLRPYVTALNEAARKRQE